MTIYTQTNPAWANRRIGNTNSTMRGFGCLVTTVSNITGVHPTTVLAKARYVNDLFDWYSLKAATGWDFVERVRQNQLGDFASNRNNPNRQKLINLSNQGNPDWKIKSGHGIALEVRTPGILRHWVMVLELVNGGYSVLDPLDGRIKFKPLTDVLGFGIIKK